MIGAHMTCIFHTAQDLRMRFKESETCGDNVDSLQWTNENILSVTAFADY